jgi:TRAP-type mannitol/chloroaromatic compound transport system substrate-binding protein
MARKRLVTVALALAMIILPTFASAADDNPTVRWNYVSAWDVNNPLLKYDQYIAEKVSKATNGKFTIKVYAAGEMVPAFETFDAVSSGAFEAGSTAPAYQAGINSAFTLFSTVPLYMSQQDFMNWLYQVDGLNLMNELLERYDIVAFPNSIFDLEAGFRSHKEIKSVNDFKGMKIRIAPPESQEILRRLGAAPTNVSGGELYDAMQRGIIDAFEFMTPNVDWDLGFQEIAKYWIAPAWYQTACVYYTLVNADAWRALPENYRVIFEEVTKACVLESSSFMNWQSAVGTKKFLDYGVKVSKADEQFWSDMEVIVKQVMEDFASKNPDYAKTLKSQIDYLKTYNLWRELEEPFHSGRITKVLPEVKDAWLKK